MTITVTAHDLTRITGQVFPHRHPDAEYLPLLNAVHLDSDGTHLHAAATDRYTFAVARARLRAAGSKHNSEPWAHTIPASAIKALRRLIKNENPHALVTITPSIEGRITHVTFEADGNSLTVQALEGTFPSWRKLIAGVIGKEPSSDVVGIDADYADRWQHAERHLVTWHTGPTSPIVFAGEDFIGLHMPVRPSSGQYDTAVTAKTWASSLGDAEPMEAAEALGQAAPGKQHRDFMEDLLRRVVYSGEEMDHGVRFEDPRWRDVLNTNIYAWIGVRLLRALTNASPGLTEKTLRDLDEELEGGEFSEWAWQYAQEAGHDPEKWAAEHAEHRAAKAAEAKAAEGPAD